jgi:hypothetical protein
VGLSFWRIPFFSNHDSFAIGFFFAMLLPVRVLEWRLLLRWICGKFSFSRHQQVGLVTGGIATSFALDVAGIFLAFVMPGGMWVC